MIKTALDNDSWDFTAIRKKGHDHNAIEAFFYLKEFQFHYERSDMMVL